MPHSSITQLATDVEEALEKNFSPGRIEAFSAVTRDFFTLRQIATKVTEQVLKLDSRLEKKCLSFKFEFQVSNGEGVPGLTVDRVKLLLKDPLDFSVDLIRWADDRVK